LGARIFSLNLIKEIEKQTEMKKKKIVIVGPAYPYRGGNALFISHLYDQLIKHFDVTVLNYSLLYPSFLFPGTTQFDKSNNTLSSVKSERIVNSISPLSWFKTANRIKQVNPDLVVFDWWHPFFSFCHYSISNILKKHFGKKILFITENVISHESHFIDKILTRLGLSNASSFLALSKKVEEDLSGISHSRKVYRSELPVYDCYDIDESSKEREITHRFFQASDFVLLFFGYIRKYKGLDLLLEAMPLIAKSIPNAKLLVVGESYDDFSIYEKMVEEMGIRDSVKLENRFVANEEVGNYYSQCDLVVLPYRSATQSGILNVAYGFLKPVLATNVGGLAEFIDEEQTGIVVNPNSPEAIAEGVSRFFQLRNETDFKKNIANKISKNQFSDIAELFSKIISEAT